MSYCHVSNQVAINADEESSFSCWSCEETITEDEDSHEVLTRDSGLQHVCTDCLDEHFVEGL